MNPVLERFMERVEDGVFIVGHSSALVRINRKLFLFDPIWDAKPYGEYWTFFPSQVNCDEILPELTGCFVSHVHADHLHLPILSRLKCPIFIMDGRPQLKAELSHLDVTEVPAFERRFFPGTDISICFLPHSFNTIDSSVIIESSSYSVYVGSDNFLDMNLIRKAKDLSRRPDIALIPTQFIHYYPFLCLSLTEAERRSEIYRLTRQSIEQAKNFREFLNPKITVPFGGSLFYDSGWNHILNRYLIQPFQEGFSALFAGDQISGETIDRFYSSDREYFSDLQQFLGAGETGFSEIHAPKYPPAGLGTILDRVRKAPRINYRFVINESVIVDGRTLQVDYLKGPIREPYVAFMLAEKEYEQWHTGQLTMEQVIGTRRFAYKRFPNVYNLESVEWFSKWL